MSASDLLHRAHSPATASRLLTERVQSKPLPARPTSPPPATDDARARRQRARAERHAARKQKPRPLSAKRRRALGLYEIPPEQARWDVFVPLRRMWRAYVREILGVSLPEDGRDDGRGNTRGGVGKAYVTPQAAGPMLASADYHGAEVEVVRSRCVSRVGVKGIVVKDTKFTFEVITRGNRLKTIPKEHTIFKFCVPLMPDEEFGKENEEELAKPRELVFELHGPQFKNRAPDRAKKSFKQHFDPDL